jgi:hypothetical protein
VAYLTGVTTFAQGVFFATPTACSATTTLMNGRNEHLLRGKTRVPFSSHEFCLTHFGGQGGISSRLEASRLSSLPFLTVCLLQTLFDEFIERRDRYSP